MDSKSNEIPAVRELSQSLDLAGRIVTVDALHAQHETMRCLRGRAADYVVAIKDNQQTILEDLRAIDFTDAPSHETVDKDHGRIERRRCAVAGLSGTEWDGYAHLHGRRQALRIQRERHLPRNLACLTNVAIAMVRSNGRFRYLPEANRHYAARAQEALDAVLIAPIA